MKIYIISLSNAIENRSKITLLFNKLNIINYEIVDAVDGKMLKTYNIYGKWRDPWSHLHLTQGEIGCALSHISIWEKIETGKDAGAIILEDDFIISHEEAFCNIANYNEIMNFDLLYLGRKKMSSEIEPIIDKSLIELNISNSINILNAESSYWTIGYVLSKQGALFLNQGLVNEISYKNNIFPVDEYIPWLFGKKSIYGLKDNQLKNLKYLTFDPPIIKPRNNAFSESGTYFSDPVPQYNNNISLVSVGTEENDCVKRYRKSCNRYGYNPIILGLDSKWTGGNMAMGMGGGQKINLLKRYLETLEKNILIIFTDSYDVIANNHVTEMLDIYRKNFNGLIVFGSEKACWPDQNLKGKYPSVDVDNKYLNSGNFIGWSDDLKKIVEMPIENNADDQLYYTYRFLESLQFKTKIVLDYDHQLFLCLNGEYKNIIEYKKSCVTINNNRPCFIHGNGPEATKLRLNRISNYCVAGWNDTYGYKCTNKNTTTPKIMIVYEDYPEYNEKTMKSILDINYPSNKITHVYVHETEKNKSNIKNLKQKFICVKVSPNLFETLENMAKKIYNCDYVFYVNSHAVFENNNILNCLVRENKPVIGPLLKSNNTLLSNFWGDIDSNNFYKRSNDYIYIANRERKGCWNVPYIWYALLIQKDHFNKNHFIDNINKGDGVDMAFCYNIRKSNYFMWVLNNEHFGYYQEPLSLISFKSNLKEWENKYISKNFQKNRSIQELGSDILKINIFTREFCNEIILLSEQNNLWSKGGGKYYDKRINNTENHPTQDIHLKQIGLEEMWKFIIDNYIGKIVWDVYKYSSKGTNINFIVKYDLKGQKELRPHHDSSSYTVNLCLNKDFEGGGCRFVRQDKTIINKDIGSVILHPGRVTHYHEGLLITSGVRYILVSFVN